MAFMRCAVALALATSWWNAATAQVPDIRRGAGRSPVAWHSSGGVTEAERSRVVAVVRERVSQDVSGVQVDVGALTDSTPLGVSLEGRSLLRASVAGVRLSGPAGASCRINVTVVLAVDGTEPLVAYTESRPEWCLPWADSLVREPSDALAEMASIRDVQALAASDRLESTLAEVLERAWRWGVDPRSAGQIIVRPRRVSTTHPPAFRGDQYEPDLRTAPHWIVEALGAVFGQYDPTIRPPYFSGRLLILSDADPVPMQGCYFP